MAVVLLLAILPTVPVLLLVLLLVVLLQLLLDAKMPAGRLISPREISVSPRPRLQSITGNGISRSFIVDVHYYVF